MSNKGSRMMMKAGIDAGDPAVVLIHAADAGMSAREVKEALVGTLVVMAEKSEAAAKAVGECVRGHERLTGSNSHELERAGSLRELAQKLLVEVESDD